MLAQVLKPIPANTIGIVPLVKSAKIMSASTVAIVIGIVRLQRNASIRSVKEYVREIVIAESPLRFAVAITHVLSVP